MDPISQGTIGAAFSQIAAKKSKITLGIILGFIAGVSPDLDVLFSSNKDPLFSLEYHRHFTHSIFFSPFGGLILALMSHPFLKKKLKFTERFVIATIGVATHGLLDSCTSYGTLLFWPISDKRVAWDVISIIDPVFTFVTIFFLFLVYKYKSKIIMFSCVSWVFLYLSFGYIQKQRVTAALDNVIENRGHLSIKSTVKPSIGNLFLWRSIYEFEGYYYVDAIRVLIDKKICPGNRIVKFEFKAHLPNLNKESQQSKDIYRFKWFSNDYMAFEPKINYIIDVRYSLVPNKTSPLWGIVIDANKKNEAHIEWKTNRNLNQRNWLAFISLLKGEKCKLIK